MPQVEERVLLHAYMAARSSLLQGEALVALQNFFRCMAALCTARGGQLVGLLRGLNVPGSALACVH